MESQKKKKNGLLSLFKESMTKSGEGCGPECGCHATEKDKETNTAGKGTSGTEKK